MTKACSGINEAKRVLEVRAQSSVVRIVYKVFHLEVSHSLFRKFLRFRNYYFLHNNNCEKNIFTVNIFQVFE